MTIEQFAQQNRAAFEQVPDLAVEHMMSDLLELAIEAHGGLTRWRALRSIAITLSLTGGLWRLKGYPDGMHGMRLEIDPRQPSVITQPLGPLRALNPAHIRGHFKPDCVWVEHSDGEVVGQRQDPRASFAGHELSTPWDELHELYFRSYAFWNYVTTPFLLAEAGVEAREIGQHQENGETWRRLVVRFPAHVPTHTREQTFYFSQQGLLRRVDYELDIAGAAPAAHYCFDHATFDGLVVPTLRRVVARAPEGPMLSGPTAALVQITDVCAK